MSQIPLLSGVTATEQADFNLSYPVNLEPVALETGISQGYVRSAMGAAEFIAAAGTPGIDRGGIVWNSVLFRVMGTKLVSISPLGAVAILGDVGGTGPVTLDYGFDRLAIRSGTSLYYWDGTTLTLVTDPDLGIVRDVVWFNGQYFTTDGNYIVATQLSDPTQVDPLKYGAAEQDPDMVTGMLRLRNELYVLGANTIEVFNYVGGSGFPLQVSSGATIPIGCCGPQAKVRYSQSFAFVGNARGEAMGVWLAQGGTAAKLSTRAVDDLLAGVDDPTGIILEKRASRDEERLYVHLPDRTLVYLFQASQKAQREVWYVCRSGRGMVKAYRPRNAVLAYGKWIAGDVETGALATMDEGTGEHFGEAVGWQLDTMLIYNKAKGGILHSLELVGLPGRGVTSSRPVAFMSFTTDGETWSAERASLLGLAAQRNYRPSWRPHRRFSRYMGLRFRGDSSELAGFAALEAEIEALNT